jgi:hypothetical protein
MGLSFEELLDSMLRQKSGNLRKEPSTKVFENFGKGNTELKREDIWQNPLLRPRHSIQRLPKSAVGDFEPEPSRTENRMLSEDLDKSFDNRKFLSSMIKSKTERLDLQFQNKISSDKKIFEYESYEKNRKKLTNERANDSYLTGMQTSLVRSSGKVLKAGRSEKKVDIFKQKMESAKGLNKELQVLHAIAPHPQSLTMNAHMAEPRKSSKNVFFTSVSLNRGLEKGKKGFFTDRKQFVVDMKSSAIQLQKVRSDVEVEKEAVKISQYALESKKSQEKETLPKERKISSELKISDRKRETWIQTSQKSEHPFNYEQKRTTQDFAQTHVSNQSFDQSGGRSPSLSQIQSKRAVKGKKEHIEPMVRAKEGKASKVVSETKTQIQISNEPQMMLVKPTQTILQPSQRTTSKDLNEQNFESSQKMQLLDRQEGFEAKEEVAGATVFHEGQFERLLHQKEVRFLKIDDARIQVRMQNNQLHLDFLTQTSFTTEGVEEYVEHVMQEHGFDNYRVRLKDKKRDLFIRSSATTASREARSMIDVKV